MDLNLQPILENDKVKLLPLHETDFERLYRVASDPLIWEQHPNKNRYEREVFQNFFTGALLSKGAFIIVDKSTDEVAGSTRFYDFDETENSIFIGYTFYGRKFWGGTFNPQVKKLMLDYIFQHVNLVKFHVGAENHRSLRAMEKLGATLMREVEIAYHGEPTRLNAEYHISKELKDF